VPDDAPPEHVIPQGFGVFTPDLTLDCVCKACNHFFGTTLEWPMRNESIEGDGRQLEVPVNDKQNSRCNDN
jgi:hypothetical protein